MLGIVTVRKIVNPPAPRVSAASSSAVPWLLHERNQFARDKGNGDEQGRQDDAGHSENDPHAMRRKPLAEQALCAEQQNEDETRNDRRHGEREVDQA